MIQLVRAYPPDDIGFEVLNNYLLFRKMRTGDNLGNDEIERLIEPILDKFHACKVSKRRSDIFQKQVHIKIMKEHNSMLMMQFELDKKRSLKCFSAVQVRWRSTSGGLMYFCAPPNANVDLIFPAHFFDRFIERGGLHDDEHARVKAVGKFLWHLLSRDTNSLAMGGDKMQAELYCDEGAALGYLRVLSDKDEKDKVPVLFLKTFISRDMFCRDQHRRERELAQVLPPLTHDVRAS